MHKLKQILSNLISNAVKFTPEKGRVVFKLALLEKEPKHIKLHFCVQDSGIGVPDDVKEKILQPFGQADESIGRNYGGTGLGLSISNKMLEYMGSSINIESKEGQGSRFWFDLVLDNCEEEYNLKQKFANHSIALYYKKANKEEERERLQRYLESICDFHIIDNAKEVISEAYDVIILFDEDIHLIDIDITDTPFMVLSQNEAIEKSYASKAFFLSIPFNASNFYEVLADACNIEEHPQKIVSKDLDLSLGGSVLVVEDHPVNRDLFAALLDQKGDIEYTMATNGFEALSVLEQKEFDLIFMDINMPVMDGLKALKEIKSRGMKTPIVALTANAIAGDREKFLEEGFSEYLAKPIEDEALNEVLRKYLHPKDRSELGFDIGTVSRELRITKEVYMKIVNSFFQTVCKDVLMIEDAVKSGDFEKIYLGAHKIKGSSSNLRIESIVEIAYEIEQNALRRTEGFDYDVVLENLKKTIHGFQEDLL